MKEFIQLILICISGSIFMIGTYYYLDNSICLSEYITFLIAYAGGMSIAANINN